MEEFLYVGFLAVIGLLVHQNLSIRSNIKRLMRTRSVIIKSSQLHSLMELEFERARRLNYPFSIVIIKVAKSFAWKTPPDVVLGLLADDSDEQSSDDSEPSAVNIFRNKPEMAVNLRSTDMAVYDEQRGRFVLLLVGTSKGDAQRIAQRVTIKLTSRLNEDVTYGCAEFPVDDLFLDDLIKRAEQMFTEDDERRNATSQLRAPD